MPDGNLYELMKKCTPKKQTSGGGEVLQPNLLCNERIVSIVRQVVNGLAHLHGMGYFHRDIKVGIDLLVLLLSSQRLRMLPPHSTA
jgi:serine/threonine protein kinase